MPERRAWCAPWLAACLLSLSAVPGHAQEADSAGSIAADPGGLDDAGEGATVLPRIGGAVPFATSLDPGFDAAGLNSHLQQAALGGTGPQPPDWSFTKSLSLDQEYDSTLSNGYGAIASGRGGAAFVTTLQPSVAVTRTTSRVQLDFDYAPALRLVEGGGPDNGGNRVTQTFDGHLLATLLPQTAFIDLRAYGSEQPRFGGSAPATATTLNTQATTQDYSFTVSPYLLHRFGGAGTAELGYSFARTLQDSPTLDRGLPGLPGPALNAIGNQDVTTQNEHLSFTTGEDFGRYNGAALITNTDDSGGGVLAGAHRRVASLDSGYAITRTLTALVRVGYEDIAYSGTSPVRIQDAIWDVGARLTASATSSFTLRYGHHDGLNALTFSGNISPTARTRLYGEYSEGLSTPIEELQNALADSDIDALGDPVDHSTGIPIYVANDVSGTQDGLYRLRRFSIGGQIQRDRDVFALSLNRDQRTLVSSPFVGAVAAGVVGSNTQTAGTLSWSRELNPTLSGVASFEYSAGDGLPGAAGLQGADGSSNTVAVSLSFNQQFSETLAGTFLYSYSDSTEPVAFRDGRSSGQHRILIGLRKTF